MIDGLYGQQCSIKKKVDWFYRENMGLLLQVRQLSVKMCAKNDFTGVILGKVSVHVVCLTNIVSGISC